MAKNKERAGIIPFYKSGEDLLMLFMKPSDAKYGGDEFQIAKGRVDPGENPLEAAVREANEELGLTIKNIKWLRKCGVYLDNHHIYMVEVYNKKASVFDKFTEETEEVKWMTLDEFLDGGRKLHKPIVKSVNKLFNALLSDKS